MICSGVMRISSPRSAPLARRPPSAPGIRRETARPPRPRARARRRGTGGRAGWRSRSACPGAGSWPRGTLKWEVEAERRLGSDGLIDIYQPISREEYRIIDTHTLEERAQYDVDKVLDHIRKLETP